MKMDRTIVGNIPKIKKQKTRNKKMKGIIK